MTGRSVPNDEMPNIPGPGRREVFPANDEALVALLEGNEPPAEPAPGLQPVADLLAALRAGPTPDELAGEAGALAEFRRVTGVAALPRRSRHRRPRVPALRLRPRLAAAGGIAVLALGGLAIAAFNGSLPPSVQRAAHAALPIAPPPRVSPPNTQVHHAKPGPSASPTPSAQPTQPPAAGPCAAYLEASTQSSPQLWASTRDSLIKAADGVGKVTKYCGRKLPCPAWVSRQQLYPAGKKVVPDWRHNCFPPDGYGRGTRPGGRGHHSAHADGKSGAQPAGGQRQRASPHAPEHSAQPNPHATELSPARS